MRSAIRRLVDRSTAATWSLLARVKVYRRRGVEPFKPGLTFEFTPYRHRPERSAVFGALARVLRMRGAFVAVHVRRDQVRTMIMMQVSIAPWLRPEIQIKRFRYGKLAIRKAS